MKNYFKICLTLLVVFLMTACVEESPMQVQSRPESGEHHINHGKDGIGNGYYLADGFVGNVIYRQPTKDREY